MHSFTILLGLLPALCTAQVAVLCSTVAPPANWTGYALTFKQSLDYNSIANKVEYGSKICQHAGAIVSNALGVDGSAAVRIEPVNVPPGVGYQPAAVIVTGPSGEVDMLNLMLRNPSSQLYNPADQSARALVQQLDTNFIVVERSL